MSYNKLKVKLRLNLSPRMRAILKSLIYGVGFFGSVHVTISVITAIYNQKLSDVNPIHLINADRALGHISYYWWSFAIGWLIFWIFVGVFYYLLRRGQKN